MEDRLSHGGDNEVMFHDLKTRIGSWQNVQCRIFFILEKLGPKFDTQSTITTYRSVSSMAIAAALASSSTYPPAVASASSLLAMMAASCFLEPGPINQI